MAPGIKVRYDRSDIQPGLQAYGLKVSVTESTDMPREIFIVRRDVQPANVPATSVQAPDADPGNLGIPNDTFICVADPVDLEEVPTDLPKPGVEMPYYRVNTVELWFRSMDLLDETYQFLADDFNKLVASMKSLAVIAVSEEVTYG